MSETMITRARTIVDQATSKKLYLRLLGALAIRMRSPTSVGNAANRPLTDLDFFGLSKQRGSVETLLSGMGLDPEEGFNSLHGDTRLIFYDKINKFTVDVFFDKFEMCHTFDFRSRLQLHDLTLPLADLLMTKLQIVELNEKDLKDIVCLLHDHDLAMNDSDAETINADYIARLCARDWGIYRTFTMNLQRVSDRANIVPLDHDSLSLVRKRTEALKSAIEGREKTMRWKLRARVGDSRRWYELPESRRQ